MADVVFVMEKVNYKIKAMRSKLIFLLSILLCIYSSIAAQEVYHYRLVAKVDPETGKRTEAKGDYLHITFSSDKSSLHLVDEFGQPTNRCFFGTATAHPNVYMSTSSPYLPPSFAYYYGDYDNRYRYVRNENGMLIYVNRYSYEVKTNGVGGYFEKFEWWLYFSQDFKRINQPTENTATHKYDWINPIIKVYELYDIDQVTTRPSKDVTGRPTVMY